MPQLADVEVDFVSLVDKAAVRDPENPTEPRRFLVYKREGTPTAEGSSMSETELREALDKAEREKAEAQERATAAETAKAEAERQRDEAVAKADAPSKKPAADTEDGAGDDNDADDVSKSDKGLPEAVRAEIAKRERAAEERAEARIRKAEEKADAADTLAKAERDLRVEGEFVTKAEGYTHLPVKASEFGPLLKRASEALSSDDFAALSSLLDGVNNQIATSDLFKQVGSSVGGSSESDVWGEIKRRAADLRKSDSGLSQEAAEVEVVKADPMLQARVQAEEG